MEQKVLDILKEVMELESVDNSLSQSTCDKWDSMAQLSISVELESEFGVTLEPEEIAQLTSFEAIVKVLNNKL